MTLSFFHNSRSYGASSNGRPPPSPSYTSPYLTDIHSSSRYSNKRSTGLMNGGTGIQSSSMSSYSSSSLPPRPSQGKSNNLHSGSSSSQQQDSYSSFSSRHPRLSKRSMSLSPSRLDEVKVRETLTPVIIGNFFEQIFITKQRSCTILQRKLR